MSHHGHKQVLLERLRELGIRIDTIESALEAPHSKDWEEMAVEREDDEVLERLGASAEAEVMRIMAALKRMADGVYGTCARCGETIAAARLKAVPATPLCRDCAAASKA